LLETVMRDGRRLAAAVDLDDARAHCRDATTRLPAAVRGLAPADPPYAVSVSEALAHYHDEVTHAVRR
jgi:hypothetical protein